MRVRELEMTLFNEMPRAWAEPWDRVGMSVGNLDDEVRGIALALNASSANVRWASKNGANVLLTHHPICLSMPDTISPDAIDSGFAGSCFWTAVREGVSVLSYHTNLDRCPEATLSLPLKLGLQAKPGLERGRSVELGLLGSCAKLPSGQSLGMLGRLCKERLGDVAQVYGDPDCIVTKAGFFTGSLGDSGLDAVAAGCDVVVCGECGYHKALDLLARGCNVIVLGHDISEFGLVEVLAEKLSAVGLSKNLPIRVPEEPSWRSF